MSEGLHYYHQDHCNPFNLAYFTSSNSASVTFSLPLPFPDLACPPSAPGCCPPGCCALPCCDALYSSSEAAVHALFIAAIAASIAATSCDLCASLNLFMAASI